MRKRRVYQTLLITAPTWLASCSDDDTDGGDEFNPSQPTEITESYSDSGGIATLMVIGSRNFDTDTTDTKVCFEDINGIKHSARLVSNNGSRVYAFTLKGLTSEREVNILVGRRTPDGQEYIGKALDQFPYKTRTGVSTVVGSASPDNNINTAGGDLATCTSSSPFYLCIDGEDNIFVADRKRNSEKDKQSNTTYRNEKGEGVNGNISMIFIANNSSIVLKYGAAYTGALAYSDEKDAEAVYISNDAGMKYYDMQRLLDYVPRYRAVLKSEKLSTVDENDWKHCFVISKLDHMIYAVMWKGQLVRINLRNRIAEILLKKISNVATGNGGKVGSDSYVAFGLIKGEEDVFCVSLADLHQIWRMDVSKIIPEGKDTHNRESYIGKIVYGGAMNGEDWGDGLLKSIRFRHPRQICFTDDGKMHIADSGNSCIHVIDTAMPRERAAVTTPIGLPGTKGYEGGGPEITKFYFPRGVAVNSGGTTVYITSTQNKVIRKLFIE